MNRVARLIYEFIECVVLATAVILGAAFVGLLFGVVLKVAKAVVGW